MIKRMSLSALSAALIGGIFATQAVASEVTYRNDIKPIWEKTVPPAMVKNHRHWVVLKKTAKSTKLAIKAHA